VNHLYCNTQTLLKHIANTNIARASIPSAAIMYIYAYIPHMLFALTITHVHYALATTITNSTRMATSQKYDYIIVGAGLTGITVGNKLSGAGYSVLIIEAGPDARWNPAVYNAEERGNLNGYCNWKYPAYDEEGQALWWTIDSGACIGGSTSSKLYILSERLIEVRFSLGACGDRVLDE